MTGRGVGRWFEMVILAPPREGVASLPREGVEGVVALHFVPLRAVFLKKGLMCQVGRQKQLLHTRQIKAPKKAKL